MTDTVLAALRDLTFFETPVEGMAFALVTALQVLPSLGGLALLRDDESGGYGVVYARGPRASAAVRSRVPEDDPFVALALVRGGPLSVEYRYDTPPPDRHAGFGDPWSALVTPIQLAERCVGVIELVDPLEARPAGESGRSALAAIAQHLALFLRGRPLRISNAFSPAQIGLDGEEP